MTSDNSARNLDIADTADEQSPGAQQDTSEQTAEADNRILLQVQGDDQGDDAETAPSDDSSDSGEEYPDSEGSARDTSQEAQANLSKNSTDGEQGGAATTSGADSHETLKDASKQIDAQAIKIMLALIDQVNTSTVEMEESARALAARIANDVVFELGGSCANAVHIQMQQMVRRCKFHHHKLNFMRDQCLRIAIKKRAESQ